MDIAVIRERMALLDVEASGLMPGSFPVEVAWLAGSRGSAVIDPSGHWDESRWDPDAEAMHGLSVQQVRRLGRHPKAVAAALDRALRGRVAFTDSPCHDAAWLDMLHQAAGIPRRYRVDSIGRLLGHLGIKPSEAYMIFSSARESHPPRGRARAGVDHLSAIFETAARRRQ